MAGLEKDVDAEDEEESVSPECSITAFRDECAVGLE